MPGSMAANTVEFKTPERKAVETAKKSPAKADVRDLFPEACKRIAFKVRQSSSEAARKEWGTTQAAAVEALVKYDLYPLVRKLCADVDDLRDQVNELKGLKPRRGLRLAA
jgi:hypothetical protein